MALVKMYIMKDVNKTRKQSLRIEIKDAIKNAILDGVIRNDYDDALAFMIKKAAELGIHKTN